MSPALTRERLESAKAICDKATPGPWNFDGEDVIAESGEHVVCFGHDYDDYGSVSPPDAEFIALSRTLLPDLLSVVHGLIALQPEIDEALRAYDGFTSVTLGQARLASLLHQVRALTEIP